MLTLYQQRERNSATACILLTRTRINHQGILNNLTDNSNYFSAGCKTHIKPMVKKQNQELILQEMVAAACPCRQAD